MHRHGWVRTKKSGGGLSNWRGHHPIPPFEPQMLSRIFYLDLSSTMTFRRKFRSHSIMDLKCLWISWAAALWSSLEAIFLSLSFLLIFLWALEVDSFFFLISDLNFLNSFEWSLSTWFVTFLQSSNLSCKGPTRHSIRAVHKVFIRDSIDLCRITSLVKQEPMSLVEPIKQNWNIYTKYHIQSGVKNLTLLPISLQLSIKS